MLAPGPGAGTLPAPRGIGIKEGQVVKCGIACAGGALGITSSVAGFTVRWNDGALSMLKNGGGALGMSTVGGIGGIPGIRGGKPGGGGYAGGHCRAKYAGGGGGG